MKKVLKTLSIVGYFSWMMFLLVPIESFQLFTLVFIAPAWSVLWLVYVERKL